MEIVDSHRARPVTPAVQAVGDQIQKVAQPTVSLRLGLALEKRLVVGLPLCQC